MITHFDIFDKERHGPLFFFCYFFSRVACGVVVKDLCTSELIDYIFILNKVRSFPFFFFTIFFKGMP